MTLQTEKEKMQKIINLYNEMTETYNSPNEETKEHIQSQLDILHPAFATFNNKNNSKELAKESETVKKRKRCIY